MKDGEQRHVPLTRPFRAFLKRYLKELDPLDFALKPDVPHGNARDRYDFWLPFEKFMAAQRLPWVTPHVIRHTFASTLKIAGKSIAKIADWLGDTERVTERNYAYLLSDDEDIHALS